MKICKNISILLLCVCSLHIASAQIGSRRIDFDVNKYGFKFVNSFETEIVKDIRFGGLCGGMTYTSLDCYKARKAAPTQTFRPAAGSPLFNYIKDRQLNSLGDNIDKWGELLFNPFGLRTDEFFNWGVQANGKGRLLELKTAIDRGTPVPLGLIKPGNGGAGPHHQVLAIGYNGGRYRGDLGAFITDVEIEVLDPNYPGQTRIMKPDPVRHLYYYKGDDPGNTHDQWQTYFVDMKYQFHTPPDFASLTNPTDGLIHDLLLEIRTGNDDLRGGGDNLNITVNFSDKPAQTLLNINKGGRWINNYTETVPVHLTTPVSQAELKAIVFNTTFRGGIDGDNWNMDMVRVLKTDGTEILKRSGSPLFRFTGDAKLYNLPFAAAGPTPDGKISRLDFEIKTGGDDLRGGNDNLNIRVAYKDGTFQMAGNVNKGTNWDNNTIKYVSVDLDRPVPLDQLRNITLSTTFGGGMGGDNWNMQYIIVQARSATTVQEIYRKEGNPLKRFTGSDKFYAINF